MENKDQQTIEFENGDKFTGELRNGKPHGKGTIKYGRLSFDQNLYHWGKKSYEGDFWEGVPFGKGVFEYRIGDKYEGDVVSGEPHGHGVMSYHTIRPGSYYHDYYKYEGDFAFGLPHGKGVMQYYQGGKFDGAFANGIPNGKGVYYYKLNRYVGDNEIERYEGDFADGKFHGKGATYSKGGAKVRYGDFEHGFFAEKVKIYPNGDRYAAEVMGCKPHGKAIYSYAKGKHVAIYEMFPLRYEGSFKDGKPTGDGVLDYLFAVLYFECGSTYNGEFEGGIPNGKGSYEFANKFVYRGYVTNGLPNDKDGALSDRNTRTHYRGGFANGKKHGLGAEYRKDGILVRAGEWQNDEFIKDISQIKKQKELYPRDVWYRDMHLIMHSPYYYSLTDKQHGTGKLTGGMVLGIKKELGKRILFATTGECESNYLDILISVNSLAVALFGLGGQRVLKKAYGFNKKTESIRIAKKLGLSAVVVGTLENPSQDNAEESITKYLDNVFINIDSLTPKLRDGIVAGYGKGFMPKPIAENDKTRTQAKRMEYAISQPIPEEFKDNPLDYFLQTKEGDLARNTK